MRFGDEPRQSNLHPSSTPPVGEDFTNSSLQEVASSDRQFNWTAQEMGRATVPRPSLRSYERCSRTWLDWD
jgi:hypothetical protein